MKTCFKCHRSLQISEFYAHPKMADGHLGKCKDCTRADSTAREELKRSDPQWVEQELERHREKSRRYRDAGREKRINKEKKRAATQKHKNKFPDRFLARNLVAEALKAGLLNRKPCSVCGSQDSEAHHEDYSKPLDIIWYCPAHHSARHVEIRKQNRLPKATTTT